ncbi:MAG: 2-alkenal reductase [Chloroflexia bacterium]|nr:2-alkenal reductase [Chloroflexia bacterium]
MVVALLALSTLVVTRSIATGASGLPLPSAAVEARATPTQAAQALVIEQPITSSNVAQTGVLAPVYDATAAVKQTAPAVVTIVNTQNVVSPRRGIQGQATSSGSGVIISKDGYIVTNNHVVENQTSLEVIFSDGTTAAAKLVGTDPSSDLAVIKVDVAVPAVAQFGDSSALEAGQPVLAIGSPLGDFRNTVTQGVVSALHRDLQDSSSQGLQDLVQTDAAINEGNSGGPLIDLSGRVIAINVAVVRNTGTAGDVAEGLGFAIPSNTVSQVVDQLIAGGSVSRPYLGVSSQLITPQMAAYYNLSVDHGLLVQAVEAGSPAAQAGLLRNSIITRFDGQVLDSSTSLPGLLAGHKVGDSVKLTVIAPNSSTEQEVTVVLQAPPNV